MSMVEKKRGGRGGNSQELPLMLGSLQKFVYWAAKKRNNCDKKGMLYAMTCKVQPMYVRF